MILFRCYASVWLCFTVCGKNLWIVDRVNWYRGTMAEDGGFDDDVASIQDRNLDRVRDSALLFYVIPRALVSLEKVRGYRGKWRSLSFGKTWKSIEDGSTEGTILIERGFDVWRSGDWFFFLYSEFYYTSVIVVSAFIINCNWRIYRKFINLVRNRKNDTRKMNL